MTASGGEPLDLETSCSFKTEGSSPMQFIHDMGGCESYGPFLGYPKRDHNFDNHPYDSY